MAALAAPPAAAGPAAARRMAAAWAVLEHVPDPEVPVLSLCDLGVVREVRCDTDTAQAPLDVVLTPTYSGCPATEVIAASVQSALLAAGLGPVRITQRLAPAWTTDWISEAGRLKLREYGIAPPAHLRPGAAAGGPEAAPAQPIRLRYRSIECPRCASRDTERLSAFGATACKALYRCVACREPFEYFKPI